MKFFSTRDHSRIVTASQAIAQACRMRAACSSRKAFAGGLGGIVPAGLSGAGHCVVSEYLTDYSKDFLAEAARTTYGEAFGGKAGHLAPVEGDTYALELWHGPTCAFKDYALQLMPKLLVEAKKNLSRTEKTSSSWRPAATPAKPRWTATTTSRASRSPCSTPRAAPARSSACRWPRRGCKCRCLCRARQLRRRPDRREEGLRG